MKAMVRRFPVRPKPLPLAVTRVTSSIVGAVHSRDFAGVETFCMFIGYPRSGHSLVGSLLDAHPSAVVSHELDALGFFQAGFRRHQVYALVLNNARAAAARGREQTGYPYAVPGSWQGRFDRLRVMGDKRGETSTVRLGRDPGLVDAVRRRVGRRLAFVHVVRNPFDNISTMAKRRGGDLERSAELYFSLCETIASVRSSVPRDDFLDLRHESLIADPRATLKELCAFLDLEVDDDFVDRCAAIVFRSPHRSRHEAPWSDELIRSVERRLGAVPFLDGYAWDD